MLLFKILRTVLHVEKIKKAKNIVKLSLIYWTCRKHRITLAIKAKAKRGAIKKSRIHADAYTCVDVSQRQYTRCGIQVHEKTGHFSSQSEVIAGFYTWPSDGSELGKNLFLLSLVWSSKFSSGKFSWTLVKNSLVVVLFIVHFILTFFGLYSTGDQIHEKRSSTSKVRRIFFDVQTKVFFFFSLSEERKKSVVPVKTLLHISMIVGSERTTR